MMRCVGEGDLGVGQYQGRLVQWYDSCFGYRRSRVQFPDRPFFISPFLHHMLIQLMHQKILQAIVKFFPSFLIDYLNLFQTLTSKHSYSHFKYSYIRSIISMFLIFLFSSIKNSKFNLLPTFIVLLSLPIQSYTRQFLIVELFDAQKSL